MDKKYLLIIILILISLLVSYLTYMSQNLKRSYRAQANQLITTTNLSDSAILTENDIKYLPEPVQKYLKYTGVIGKEKVINFRVVGEGLFKTEPKKDWVKAKAQQYNLIEPSTRLYYMKLNMFGLPIVGLHSYKDAAATMIIKVLGLVKVADAKGDIMNKAETVTVFNDMCLSAPASLIDKRIEWETIDPLKVKATFNNKGVKISAVLSFNEKGEMINFVSNDRYMTSTGENYVNAPWSTPVKDYKDFNGIKLASYGEAIWSLPEGDYCYGKIFLKEIEYNCKSFK